jgi:hypothetical protein
MNRKTLVFLVIFVAAIAIPVVLYCFHLNKIDPVGVLTEMNRKSTFTTIEARIKTIKLGFTKEQVRNIMGEPLEFVTLEDGGLKTEIWIFPHPKVASEPPRCVFDEENGKVIEVVCGDNYRIAVR